VGEVYWPWQGNQLKDRDVHFVVEALRELDPDVVLLQELADAGQLERLEHDRFGVRRYDGATPSCCGYDRHVAVLVKRELGARFYEHVLAPTSRGLVEARFDVPVGEGTIEARAFSLHFDVFQAERRLEQARTAMAFVGELGELSIAGGDFNYDPTASARLGRVADEHTEAELQRVFADVAEDVGPTLIGLLRVDRVFAGGRALASAAARTTPHRLPLGDHAPVLCDLTLRPSHARPGGGD
jgi:endonuclease/exonuclease/phosphatase family metal-dependent hydrolase